MNIMAQEREDAEPVEQHNRPGGVYESTRDREERAFELAKQAASTTRIPLIAVVHAPAND